MLEDVHKSINSNTHITASNQPAMLRTTSDSCYWDALRYAWSFDSCAKHIKLSWVPFKNIPNAKSAPLNGRRIYGYLKIQIVYALMCIACPESAAIYSSLCLVLALGSARFVVRFGQSWSVPRKQFSNVCRRDASSSQFRCCACSFASSFSHVHSPF